MQLVVKGDFSTLEINGVRVVSGLPQVPALDFDDGENVVEINLLTNELFINKVHVGMFRQDLCTEGVRGE